MNTTYMNVELSVIVPVYNAEQFLDKCVDSLINQEEKVEIILVDDGSTDKSPSICDNFAVKYDNITVIHKENAGVSAARNDGINIAQGKYIGFVDSDDWVEPQMFSRLLKEAKENGADIVICDATTVYSNGHMEVDTITKLPHSTALKKEEIVPEVLLEIAGSVWRCIYLKSSFDHFKFPVGIKFSEDRIFNLYAMGNAKKIQYIKEPYYNRFMNVESAVHRFHNDYFEANKCSAYEISAAIKNAWGDKQEIQVAYLEQFINGSLMAICNYFYKTSTFTFKEKIEAVKKVCNDDLLRQAIQKYGPNKINKLILNRNYFLLAIYAILANYKYKR